MWKSLLVQGAAGGGKTTIALHRIAYLLYNYENTLSPKNFMIIAPNRFFLSYISEVLPDLVVENVIQTTFEDFAANIIGKKLKLKNPYEYYKQLLSDKALFHKLCCPYIDKAMTEQIRVDTLHNLNENKIELEDLAPLMYMKYMIEGLEEKLTARHVVIDEAQDFSVFQLFILKKLIGGNSFTILGDLCQGIYSYRGINDWKSAAESIFGEGNYSMLTLEQSYRTTIEIIEAANSVIKFLNDPKLPPSKPVIRHGDAVKVIEKSSLKEVARVIVNQVSRLKEEGFKSAAIICKTLEECKQIKVYLNNY